MGHDPATSVVDGWGRLHDVDNVYVADGSVFVSAGGFNPSLTIMALSLRMSRRLSGGLPTLRPVTPGGGAGGAARVGPTDGRVVTSPATGGPAGLSALGTAVTAAAAAALAFRDRGLAARRPGSSDGRSDGV
jgi:hypothetical protein